MKKVHKMSACLLLLSGIAVAQAAKPAEPETVSQVLARSGRVRAILCEKPLALDGDTTGVVAVEIALPL